MSCPTDHLWTNELIDEIYGPDDIAPYNGIENPRGPSPNDKQIFVWKKNAKKSRRRKKKK
jgi:hypothetical protein